MDSYRFEACNSLPTCHSYRFEAIIWLPVEWANHLLSLANRKQKHRKLRILFTWQLWKERN
jgi:hypothetical protein